MRSAERRKVNVLEMKCLRSFVGVSRIDRVRIEEVSMRAGIERELASRADKRVFRLFGHVERMDEYRMARRVWRLTLSRVAAHAQPCGGSHSAVWQLTLSLVAAHSQPCGGSRSALQRLTLAAHAQPCGGSHSAL